MEMTIDLPPHDSGSQPKLAFAPFYEEDVRKIRRWQSRDHVDLFRAKVAELLTCCQEPMNVKRDGLHCQKCGKEQEWVPGVVLEVDLAERP
jgi:hypothetical protein